MKRLLALFSLLLLAACTSAPEQEDTQPSTDVPSDENTTNPSEPADDADSTGDEDTPEDNSDNSDDNTDNNDDNTDTPVDEPELEIDFPPAPENPAEPNLPACLLGAEPVGCAAPPEPIVIEADECPLGWELSTPEDADVPAMCMPSAENNCPAGEWPEIALPEYCVGVNAGDTISPGAVINIYIDDDAPIGSDGFPTGNGLCPTHAVPSISAGFYLAEFFETNYGLTTANIVLAKGLYADPITNDLGANVIGACSAETRVFPIESSVPAAVFNTAGEAEFSGVTVRSLAHGIVVSNLADVTMTDVRVVGGYSGLRIAGASVVANDLFIANLIEDPTDPDNSAIGVLVQGDSSLVATGLHVGECRDGIIVVDAEASARVNHGNIHGVMFGVKVQEGTFRADGLTIEEFFRHGIVSGGSVVAVRSMIRNGNDSAVIVHKQTFDARGLYIKNVVYGVTTDESYSPEAIDSIQLQDVDIVESIFGVVVDTGVTELERVRIRGGGPGNALLGLGNETQITFNDLTISDRTIDPNETDEERIKQQGWGVRLEQGATVSGERLNIDRTKNVAVYLADAGTSLNASDVLIRDTTGHSDDLMESLGIGLAVEWGASATFTRGLIENSSRQSLYVQGEGSNAVLTDVVTREGLELDEGHESSKADEATESSKQGGGVAVLEGASIMAERLLVSRAAEVGIGAWNATANLKDVIVNHTRVSELSNNGVPFVVSNAGTAEVERIRIRGGYKIGVMVQDPNSVATMSDVWVERIKRSPGDETGGFGVVVTNGGDLDAEYIFVSGTEGGASASWMPDSSMRLGNAVLLGKTRESVEIDDFDIDDFDIDDFDEVEEVENEEGSVEIDDFDIDDFDIDDFDIDDFDRDGASALWGASASISSGVVMGFSRAAVQVTDAGGTSDGASVELSEVEIVDNLFGVNVFSVENEEASVELSEVEFSGNGTESSSEMMSVEEPPQMGVNASVELEAGEVEMSSVE